MDERERIISKAKKLFRMGQEMTNEGEIARRQLNNLKAQYDLNDASFLPIFKHDVLVHDKHELLSSTQEILLNKIGSLCGNTVLVSETSDKLIVIYKGNDRTIANANKIMNFIDDFTDDMVRSILETSASSLESIKGETDSIKLGLVAKITSILARDVHGINTIDEHSIEHSSTIVTQDDHHSMVPLKRVLYDKTALMFAANLIDDLHMIPILAYVREILGTN